MSPIGARLDDGGDRIYTWTGRGYIEEFYSVTTMLGSGIPKHLQAHYAKLAAELAYEDVRVHGKRAMRRWATEGRRWVKERQANGELRSIKADRLTDADFALRWLKGAAERHRDKAASRGTAVHDEAESVILARVREGARAYFETGELPEWTGEMAPYMASFVRFINDRRPRYLATEATVYSRSGVYAGTGDAFLEMPLDGRWQTICLDYKTGKAIYPEVALQTCAYARGEFIGGADRVTEFPVPKVDLTAVLLLTPTGYNLQRLRYDDTIYAGFLYAREVFRWVKETSKTAIVGPIAQDLEDALAASLEVA